MTQETVIILYAATIVGAALVLAVSMLVAGYWVASAIRRATDHEMEVLVSPERVAERLAAVNAAETPRKAP